jgi:hypothetical protein
MDATGAARPSARGRDGGAPPLRRRGDGRDARRRQPRLAPPFAARPRSDELFRGDPGPPRLPAQPAAASSLPLSCVPRRRCGRVRGEAARPFAGCAAHSFLPLERACSAAFGLALGVARTPSAGRRARRLAPSPKRQGAARPVGWRSSQANASVPAELPRSRVVLSTRCARSRASPATSFRRISPRRSPAPPGAFKVDGRRRSDPVARGRCARAATVHVRRREIAASSALAGRRARRAPLRPRRAAELFDRTARPDGKQTGWAYAASRTAARRQTDRIAADRALRAASASGSSRAASSLRNDLERNNENYVGGDVAGRQRPARSSRVRSRVPHAEPRLSVRARRLWRSVHALPGFFAARAALTG